MGENERRDALGEGKSDPVLAVDYCRVVYCPESPEVGTELFQATGFKQLRR